ncbi:unnamed protein product [Phytophthora fragariaefolia]|uniref:Unnamed protein product n=1 Tax=Phytophthora fragariaefolia TaxID=1490495 RepID=A0A9W6WZX8_9STRA|nr:unnamed protein product [Phytophthora fragariaefolia]
MDLRDETVAAYADDAVYANILAYLRSPSDETLGALSGNTRNQINRYHLDDDLLCYNIDRFDAPRVVVSNDDDLRDLDSQGARTCGTCQRVKASKLSQAPLHPLPIATEDWHSVFMHYVFGLLPGADGRNGVLVFVDRFTKVVYLTLVSDMVTAAETAANFVDCVFRHHALPGSIVSDRDPRFTSACWTAIFQLLGTKLSMSTAAHPETDDQTERVNRVLKDILRSYATFFPSWSKFLPLVEFALNNAEHVSTGITPFVANNARRPRVPALLAVGHPTVSGVSTLGGDDDGNDVDDVMSSGAHDPEALNARTRSKSKQALAAPSSAASPLAAWIARTLIEPGKTDTPIGANYTPKPPVHQVDNAAVSAFVQRRESIARFVRDPLQDAVDKQTEKSGQARTKERGYVQERRASPPVHRQHPPFASNQSWREIANESATAAVPAATKTAIKNAAVTDLAVTENVAGLHIQATSTLVQHALMDTFRWATCSVVTIHSRKHYYWQKATDICQ